MAYRYIRMVITIVVLISTLSPLLAVAQEATPDASPISTSSFDPDVVAGDGVHLLRPAPEGEVAVIAMSEVQHSGALHMIVHNNTDEDVGRVHIYTVIFGEDHELLGIAGNGVAPGRILPGGIGMTTMYFTSNSYPGMVSIETLITVEEPDADSIYDSLIPNVSDWQWQDGELIVMLLNDGDEPIAKPSVRIACFDEGDQLTAIHWKPTIEDEIPVGEGIRSMESLHSTDCEQVVFTLDGERE